MKPNVAIIVSGGAVQNVITDAPINLVVIDHDTQGASEHNLNRVKGINSNVCLIHWANPEMNPEFVKQFAEGIEAEPILVNTNDNDYTMPDNMSSCWIKVGNVAVHVIRREGGAQIHAYQKDTANDGLEELGELSVYADREAS